MFLRTLRLQNIRSIGEIAIPFGADAGGRKWTYLLGENGTGKSSVLRAIGLALAGSDAAAEVVGEPGDWVRLGKHQASIEVEFATSEEQLRSARLNFRRGWSPLEFVENNRPQLREIDAAVARAERNYFIVGYGVARRPATARSSIVPSSSPFRNPRARAMGTLFNSDAPLVSLEQWAMDLDYRRGETGLSAVRSALDTLLPDVSFKGIDRERRQLMFETRDGVLPLSALSDGYQAMAAWCGDLLWQITETFADYSDPLRARGLLLIDEIDLHLHPLWQRRIVSFLTRALPNVQIVVTTHSPLTVHPAGENELFVLRREEGQEASVTAYTGAPNRLLLPQLLESPLFGLHTLDSPQVEELRDELRGLQGLGEAKARTSQDDGRIREIKHELSGVSQWRDVPDYLRQTNEVLERVAAHLESGGDGATPTQNVARKLNPRGSRSS